MHNLQDATERICELKGDVIALDALCSALLHGLPPASREQVRRAFEISAEAARVSMLHAAISEHSIAAFERHARRFTSLLERAVVPTAPQAPAAQPSPQVPAAQPSPQASTAQPSPQATTASAAVAPPRAPLRPEAASSLATTAKAAITSPAVPRITPVSALLRAVPRVSTFLGTRALTGASGFFFRRDERLFLVTSRHVLFDAPSRHLPDRIEIELHAGDDDLTEPTVLSLLLYEKAQAVWHQAGDRGGDIDVAAIEIDTALLADGMPPAFGPDHLHQKLDEVEIGTPLLIVGFPLGFHDVRHHLPVARQATVASSFNTRFQGQGLFLTDARLHRGTSGAPVVMRAVPGSTMADDPLPWTLLGIHAARLDMSSRDVEDDDSLGLNCAWYADVLLALTE
jgi:S1-C subfamily serine protease